MKRKFTKSRMEQGSRCFALRIVISISSLPVRKKGVPVRENHVPLTIVWRQVWVEGMLFRGYVVKWSANFFVVLGLKKFEKHCFIDNNDHTLPLHSNNHTQTRRYCIN